jgi:hypothetical protein
MPTFPDTSIDGITMLVLAIAVASLVSVGLQTAFGNLPPRSVLQFAIGAVAFIVGFGVVYGWEFYRSYRTAGR